jgi:hypothetical protein
MKRRRYMRIIFNTVIICVVGHGILLVRTESSVITKKTFAMFIFSTCFHNGYYNYNAYLYACIFFI